MAPRLDVIAAGMSGRNSNGNGREPPSEAAALMPYSIEAEQSVLGALMMDNTGFGIAVEHVSEASFYVHAHRLIFGAIQSLVTDKHEADVITVFEWLRDKSSIEDAGGLPYLNSLMQSVPSAVNIGRYAEIVCERSNERALLAGLNEATAIARESAAPLAWRVERINALLHEVSARAAKSADRLPLLRLHQLQAASDSVRWLVKHVFPAESIGMLYGGSGTFKSFIALDAALHVAHGLPWMGRKTSKGPVLYIAAEGGSGLWPRIDAWHRARALSWEDCELIVVPVAVNLALDAWRVVEAAQLLDVVPVLVVVDTLSQTYAGDENVASEMAAYLREIGLRFRALWKCVVLLIHHTGHLATERPRGSSVIRANVDFLLSVFRDEKEMIATVGCVKQKDGELFRDATFQLIPRTLGSDVEGDPITTLVAWHLSSEEAIEEAMEEEGKAGRSGTSSRNQLLLTLAQNGQEEHKLRKIFYGKVDVPDGDAKTQAESKRKAYYRSRSWCIKKGHFEIADGYVLLLKGPSP